MSGGIVDWSEGPTQDDRDQWEEDERRRRNWARLQTTRLPSGRYLSGPALDVAAGDERYMFFAEWVNPEDWQVAATKRGQTLAQVTKRLLDLGPQPHVLNPPHVTVREWEQKVRECYDRAMADEATEAFDFNERWHSSGGHVNDWAGNPVDDIDMPKPRPEALDGYRHTEGRPDRPSRRRRKNIVQQALGRRKTS